MTSTTIEHATCPDCGAADETRHRPTCRYAPPENWTLRPVLAGGNAGGDLDHRGRPVIPGRWYLARVYDDTEEIVAGPWTDKAHALRVAELVTSPRATVVLHPWNGWPYYSPELWWSPRDGVTTRGEKWFYLDKTWYALALSTFVPGFAALDQEGRWRALHGVALHYYGEFIQRGTQTKESTMIKTQGNPVAEYVERWIRGESIAALARESGMKRSKFRRELMKAVGGKDRYRELRKSGAGGSSTLPPPPRRRALEAPPIDDSDVPVIPHARGWKSRIVYVNRYSTSVFIDPNGTEYVRARPNEKADLIVDLDQDSIYKGLGKVRLRKLESSSLYRKLRKTQKELERGEAALERQREQRRQRRAARRKGGN